MFRVVASSSSLHADHFLYSAAMTRLSLVNNCSTTVPDKQKPKRPLNAYTRFVKDYYARHKNKAEAPMAILKNASKSWKELPEEEMKRWQEKANEEIEAFKAEQKKKAENDKFRPKQSSKLTGYHAFMGEKLAATADDGVPTKTRFKQAIEEWNSLPADQKEKYRLAAGKQPPPGPNEAKRATGYHLFMSETLKSRPDTIPAREFFHETVKKWTNLSADAKQEYNRMAYERVQHIKSNRSRSAGMIKFAR